jgi:hypothetical protein
LRFGLVTMFRVRRINAGLVGALALAILAALGPGCGSNGRKPVYRVHGTILDSKDKPAAGAMVFFHPIDATDGELIKPLGYVQEDGTFALTTYTKDDGAPQGEYSVTIEWRQPKSSPFGARNPGPDKLQSRYSDPGRSKIRFQVDPKPENTVPPIRLE